MGVHFESPPFIPKKLFPSIYYTMTSNLKALVVVIWCSMFPSVFAKAPKKKFPTKCHFIYLFIPIHVSKILDNIPNKSQSLLLVMCLGSPPWFNLKGLQSYPNSLLVFHPSMSSKCHSHKQESCLMNVSKSVSFWSKLLFWNEDEKKVEIEAGWKINQWYSICQCIVVGHLPIHGAFEYQLVTF